MIRGVGKPCSLEGRDEQAFLVWRGRGDVPGSREMSQNASEKRGKPLIIVIDID
jgi:hypothetical protein